MHLVAHSKAWRSIDDSGDAERTLRTGQHSASGYRASFGKIEDETVFELRRTDSEVFRTVHGRRCGRKIGEQCLPSIEQVDLSGCVSVGRDGSSWVSRVFAHVRNGARWSLAASDPMPVIGAGSSAPQEQTY